ncbi:hypothetical protein CPAR01_07393 [Colletotrichum paranaense]|uniref:Uncharacterized protein n=1 Tax=Colletotrichum paranaense TaxID=1914294 RepID=A0ABQ9SQD2_9PEZI|nr:uncharacterized protein CPAR01_07393 [Colletotrichum paranaense]KAK1541404.1 hypothetical protein CPAR01_07393 [Colletotrichum paranaense]
MTPQKTSDVVEESRCLPHLPNEIIVMIFDRMIAGAAADYQPITWEICPVKTLKDYNFRDAYYKTTQQPTHNDNSHTFKTRS